MRANPAHARCTPANPAGSRCARPWRVPGARRQPPPAHDARDPARARIEDDYLVIRRDEIVVEAAGLEPADRDIPHWVCGEPVRDHASAADAHPTGLRITRPRG